MSAHDHTRLVMALTDCDRRESARERIPNLYRLSHYLHAAQDVTDAVTRGARPEDAFAEYFNPTRGMHRVARTLGLALDVQRGRWEVSAP